MSWLVRVLVWLVLVGAPVSTVYSQQARQEDSGSRERGPIEKALFPDVKARLSGPDGTGSRQLALDDRYRRKVGQVESSRMTHTTYRQMHAGLPVIGRWARVSTDDLGRIRFVSSGFSAPSKDDADFDAWTSLTALSAERLARTHVAPEGGAVRDAELSVFIPGDGGDPVLVWDVLVWPDDGPAEWQVIVDARSGHVLMAQDRALRHKTAHPDPPPIGAADGVGAVFDPNPLATSGASYGAPWVDASDASSSFLDGELREVILRELTTNSMGQYLLDGPYVRIDGSQTGGGMFYSPPAEANPTNFRYNRADEHFEAVMAYYHIDSDQRYVQSLGFVDRQNAPLPVHPRAVTRDDSFYLPSLNRLLFGLGRVDDAEDATVIWHEYAHALLEAAAPGLSSTLEGIAVHEGWADYWAASKSRALVEMGAVERQDWRQLFSWDSGDGTLWAGRTLDHNGIYPADTCSDNPSPGACSPHNDGRLWATTLMEVQDVLGRDVTDRLVLHSHDYLVAPITFSDAASAVVQADMDYFDAEHVFFLLSVFDQRGLMDASAWGPVLRHEIVPNTEVGTESVEVVLDVITGVAAPQNVVLLVSDAHFGNRELTMSAQEPRTYQADLPLPPVSGTVHYWFRVTDADGGVSSLPESAPQDRFSFLVDVDQTPPSLQHNPILSGNLASWPETVVVTATDLFGVENVETTFSVVSADGDTLAADAFQLEKNGTTWSGAFPVPFSEMQKDATVTYRVTAWDTADTPNISETAWHSFTMDASGLLRRLDLTGATVSASGAWTVASSGGTAEAVPGSGPLASWSYGAAESGTAGQHELTLPSIRLDRVDHAWLTYWYRVDAEASGPIDPVNGGMGQAFDALQVQIAQDTGGWTVSEPESNYPTIVASGTGNPLSGQPAFGGSTRGWRFAVHPIATGTAVRARFVVATDDGNTEPVPDGFRVSDVRYWSELPVEGVPPEVTAISVPDRIGLTGGVVILPDVSLVAQDVSGVTDALVDVRLDGGPVTTHRMAQLRASLAAFSTPLILGSNPVPGQVVEMRLRVGDGWGNETVLPSANGWFTSTVVLLQERNLLETAVAFSGWVKEDDESWAIVDADVPADRASLNLMPVQIPSNVSATELRVTQSYMFPFGSGGVLQVSTDGGTSWSLMAPEGGYPGLLRLPDSHEMAGENGYRGNESNSVAVFDLTGFSGRQIWLRFLYVQDKDGSAGSTAWRLRALSLQHVTEDPGFEAPSTFELHTTWPNPFRTSAEITWSLDEDVDARIAVYDMLGRRVSVVAEGWMAAGTHRGSIDGSRLASGVYVVRLEAAGRFKSHTIVRQ